MYKQPHTYFTSQTPKLVSASDELVITFSKINDSKNFYKHYEILTAIFHGIKLILFHLEEIEFESIMMTII